MADVATETRQRIDDLLDYLIEAWRQLPDMAGDIARWDLIEQLDYVEEWGAKESLADVLCPLLDQPGTSAAQRARYGELQRLMRQHRPILDALRKS